ncbi:hypothetical protein ACH5RR_023720 [Cinchona calisaya]|uniref:RNase H type-1 domain-containing protein n=1 Tax=Cinchona calisaya TaxID=153742 RepID=A0ABD2ZCK5_9GENT
MERAAEFATINVSHFDPLSIKLTIDLSRDRQGQRKGIGVTTKDGLHKLLMIWGLNEDTKNSSKLEAVEAVRLTMIKALQSGWTRVHIELDNKGLVDDLVQQRSNNALQAVAIEDIIALSYLFQFCSFGYKDSSSNTLSNKVSNFASCN